MQIDNVNGFVYLGTWDNECSKEIKHVSVQVYVYVFNVLLCASETWTLKKLDKDRLLAFEMKCYRWILHIRWQQKIRNEEMSQQKRISDHNTEKTPQFFGYICRMKYARMLKAIVFGVMEGKARKERPCGEWTDDITDWCKEDLHTLRWKATDWAEWRRVVRHAIDTNGSPRPSSQTRRMCSCN